MKTQSSMPGDMDLSEFKLALLLMKWTITEDVNCFRWRKEKLSLIVNKKNSKPTLTRYTKAFHYATWHRAFQSYQEAYDYIVTKI